VFERTARKAETTPQIVTRVTRRRSQPYATSIRQVSQPLTFRRSQSLCWRLRDGRSSPEDSRDAKQRPLQYSHLRLLPSWAIQSLSPLRTICFVPRGRRQRRGPFAAEGNARRAVVSRPGASTPIGFDPIVQGRGASCGLVRCAGRAVWRASSMVGHTVAEGRSRPLINPNVSMLTDRGL
jgi:hypothetical protein